MNVANRVLWRKAIILKVNKVNLFVSSVLFVFWYHSPNFLDTPHICNICWLKVKRHKKTITTNQTWQVEESQETAVSAGEKEVRIYAQEDKNAVMEAIL
jgi:hypothetical protein